MRDSNGDLALSRRIDCKLILIAFGTPVFVELFQRVHGFAPRSHSEGEGRIKPDAPPARCRARRFALPRWRRPVLLSPWRRKRRHMMQAPPIRRQIVVRLGEAQAGIKNREALQFVMNPDKAAPVRGHASSDLSSGRTNAVWRMRFSQVHGIGSKEGNGC